MCYDYCMLWWWKRKRNSHEAHMIISQATLGPGAKIMGPFEYLPRMLRNSKYWLYLIYIIYTWAGWYSNEFFRHASTIIASTSDPISMAFEIPTLVLTDPEGRQMTPIIQEPVLKKKEVFRLVPSLYPDLAPPTEEELIAISTTPYVPTPPSFFRTIRRRISAMFWLQSNNTTTNSLSITDSTLPHPIFIYLNPGLCRQNQRLPIVYLVNQINDLLHHWNLRYQFSLLRRYCFKETSRNTWHPCFFFFSVNSCQS